MSEHTKEDFRKRMTELSLDDAYKTRIFICMRTTLNIDDNLLAEAIRSTGEFEKTAVVRMGLEALIERESARRLASLGGSMPDLKVSPRRRQKPSGKSHASR